MKTNRDYFSWSQYSLFKASKLSFHKRYVIGEEDYSNIYFTKGKELGEYMSDGIIPPYEADPLLETVGKALPHLDIMEQKLEVSMFEKTAQTEAWQKPLLMYIDSSKKDGKLFYEYKTGKIPWTQQKVDAHEQLDFYAVGYYLKYDLIPECKLYWIETEELENEKGETILKYTGHIEEFNRTFTENSIVQMMVRIMDVLKEIEAWEYVEMELDNDKVDRYIYLLEQQKDINQELGIIKLEIETLMEANDAQYASADRGRFSIGKRKSWLYTKDLLTLKKKYNDEIANMQKEEQLNKTATFNEMESLRFTKLK